MVCLLLRFLAVIVGLLTLGLMYYTFASILLVITIIVTVYCCSFVINAMFMLLLCISGSEDTETIPNNGIYDYLCCGYNCTSISRHTSLDVQSQEVWLEIVQKTLCLET